MNDHPTPRQHIYNAASGHRTTPATTSPSSNDYISQVMAPDLSFHPPGVIPPRKSSTGMANGTAYHSSAAGGYSMKTILENASPQLAVSEKLPTTTDMTSNHTRNRSSVDGTKYKDGTWSPDKEKILMGPYDYMAKHPGKDIRRQLITAFNAWLKVPSESVEVINKVVAMLHNASLLIDDVEDSSVLRRGIPVAHNIFGTAQTINSANYVYFLALQEVQKLNNVEAIDIYVKELLNLHRGQGMDLFWRDTLTCPSEDDYLEMVGNKTGGLFRLAVKLMQAESASDKDCVALVNVMGLIFQICDDYLNLSNTTYTKNKGLCEDLTEGKFSFPIIHSIRSDPSNLQLINILKQRTKDEEVKLYAVSYMKSTGSFAYTRKVVRELRDKALSLIDEIDSQQTAYGKQQVTEGQGPADGAMVRAIIEKIVESTLKDEDDDDGEMDV